MPLQKIYCSGFPRYAVSHSSLDSRSEETELGEPTALQPAGTICTSQSQRLLAVTTVTVPALSSPHGSFSCHVSHMLFSLFSSYPAQPPMLLIILLLLPSGQAKQPLLPVVSPGRIAQYRGKKLKESPFKSSSCPASRKVSLPTPQIKDTDVKLMPRLISAKKPRGFKTFIHLKL